MGQKRTRKRHKRRTRAANKIVRAGPAALQRVGGKIYVTSASSPKQFAEMRRSLAAWRQQAPSEMRAESEATLALLDGLDSLEVLGLVFYRNHLAPQLAGRGMTESYVIVEHLALLLAKTAAAGEMRIEPAVVEQLTDALSSQLRKAIMYVQPELPVDGSPPGNEALVDALQVIRSWELAVRVERYDHQQKALPRALFTPFSSELQAALGFNCDDAMRVEDAYDRRIKNVVNDGAEKSREVQEDVELVLKGKSPKDLSTAELVESIRASAPRADVWTQVSWMLFLWAPPCQDELVPAFLELQCTRGAGKVGTSWRPRLATV